MLSNRQHLLQQIYYQYFVTNCNDSLIGNNNISCPNIQFGLNFFGKLTLYCILYTTKVPSEEC